MIKVKSMALLLILSALSFAECSSMGWGESLNCNLTQDSGGLMGVLLFLGLLAVVAWVAGFILFQKKSWKLGTVVIAAALFLSTAGFLVAMEISKLASAPATQGLMESFVVVFTDLIYITALLGLLALIGYIFMAFRSAWNHKKKVDEESGNDG
jgi:hypothetical protein